MPSHFDRLPKEPVIQDKIHLLMEETGCDQGEAELAITSAGYDLEKAIRTIGVLLRNIVAVKAKFMLPGKNLYGLLILIADTKRLRFFRIRAVVSYNPSLYEAALEHDWYEFEKGLYAFRLWEGALQQVTQELERFVLEQLEREEGGAFFEILRSGFRDQIHERLTRLVGAYFGGQDLSLAFVRQELNLEQFRRFKPREEEPQPLHRAAQAADTGESLILNVDLQQASDGVPAHHIKPGDSVYVLLTDNRDIAQYLSKLLGGRSDKGLTPLTAPVEEIRRENDTLRFQIRLSVGILGLAEAQRDSLLRIEKRPSSRWWRRFIPSY